MSSREATEVWHEIKENLKLRLSSLTLATFIESPLRIKKYHKNRIILLVKSEFYLSVIKSRYLQLIQEAAKYVLGEDTSVSLITPLYDEDACLKSNNTFFSQQILNRVRTLYYELGYNITYENELLDKLDSLNLSSEFLFRLEQALSIAISDSLQMHSRYKFIRFSQKESLYFLLLEFRGSQIYLYDVIEANNILTIT